MRYPAKIKQRQYHKINMSKERYIIFGENLNCKQSFVEISGAFKNGGYNYNLLMKEK